MNDPPWLGQRAAPRHGQGTFRRRVWGKTGVRIRGQAPAPDRRVKMRPFVRAQEAKDTPPVWLIRDLTALIGVTLCLRPLVIMVLARGRKTARGRNVSAAVLRPLTLPLADARLRHALDRKALCAFGRNVRGSPPKPLLFVRIRTWSATITLPPHSPPRRHIRCSCIPESAVTALRFGSTKEWVQIVWSPY